MTFLALGYRQDDTGFRVLDSVSAAVRRQPGAAMVIDRPGLLAATFGGGAAIGLREGRGAICGGIVRNGARTMLTSLSDQDASAILGTRGQQLVDDYWGGFIAILDGGEKIDIVRAPLGNLPVYYSRSAQLTVAASSVALLLDAGQTTPSIDWREVSRVLLASELRRAATCLAGVDELRGGERLSLSAGQADVATLWSPWRCARHDRSIIDPIEAQQHIRDAVECSADALSAPYAHPLLRLSGGLDSSVVAAALAASGRRFSCLNLTTLDPAGDESDYAAIAARACGAPLVVARREVSAIDVSVSHAGHLPRPTARCFAQATDRAVADAARALGADAVFDGGGGDNVFCSLQSVAVVADRLRTTGSPRAIVQSAIDLSRVTGANIGTILRRSIVRAWLRSATYRWPVSADLLTSAACGEAAQAIEHPWLEVPTGVLPGKAAHVAMLAAAQGWVETRPAIGGLPTVAPLVAQPVVDACLRVPSWLWLDNGLNRAVARQAFARALPPEIVNRRSKGSPDSFVAMIFDTQRHAIRALLLDGELVAQGIADRTAIERALDDSAPIRGRHFYRIMQLVDVEAWLRSWAR